MKQKEFVQRKYKEVYNLLPRFMQNRLDDFFRTHIYEYRERRVSFGDLNQNKTFYVIRCLGEKQGLLNCYIEVLRKIQYANERGYIPIVDFYNYYNCCIQDEEQSYKENAWEYYFQQPQSQHSLEEVYQSKNVILSYGRDVRECRDWPKYNSRDCLLKEYHQLYVKYANLNSSIMVEANTKKDELFSKSDRVLGVSFRKSLERGMLLQDPWYVEQKCHHPKILIEVLIEKIDYYMSTRRFDAFFLAGDDRETVDIMKERYGNKCITYDRKLPHLFKGGVPTSEDEEVNKEFRNIQNIRRVREKEYLVETILLSKCCGLLGIETSSNVCACIFNNNSFEEKL